MAAARRGGGPQIQPPTEDFSSPYYLHPSDNPDLQLVSQPLNGSNYINWSRSMSTALLAKNKILFVNGVLLKPTEDDLLYAAWIRCNSMVVSWIMNSLSPQICSSIMYLDDAKEIWSDLRDSFSQCDFARVYQLKQKIMSLVQGDDDINCYFTNLRISWDEYKHTQPISCSCSPIGNASVQLPNGATVSITHIGIEASRGIVIGRGRRFGNLYTLDVSSESNDNQGSTKSLSSLSVSQSVNANSVVHIDVWHKRLGHLYFSKLKSMSETLPFSNKNHSLCDICPLAKQQHLPFNLSESVANEPFDLIHCDVWGPFLPNTNHGYKYFLTIIDDTSRFVWTFLMQNKSDVQAILVQFFNTVLTQFTRKIKTVRFDNVP
ncbi:uncharacterized protein LOC121810436 [Salvia splendens]|uniref:uncharacterized protein LOC121810436 n=1 Tax=Salvia splendens TaxID=180675 RepID=UPI001C274BF1|nr:uncharacterized protein LOC121810436 [Salvia splendens]